MSATQNSPVRFPAERLSSHTWQRIKPLCLLRYAGSPLSWRDNLGLHTCRYVVHLGSKLGVCSSTRLLLQKQYECFPCVVFWECLEKGLKGHNSFVGLCLTH